MRKTLLDIYELYNIFKEMNMRKKTLLLILVVFIIALPLALFGCNSAGTLYIKANLRSAEIMLPDLAKYIKNDKKLSPLDREIRIKSVQIWLKLIRAKAKSLEKGT